VLYGWLALLDQKLKLDSKHEPVNDYRSKVKIDEIDTAKIRIYAQKRREEGQAASSVNRELNIIAATLHEADEIFSELRQWKSPKIPRMKVSKSRRERIITGDEYDRLIAYLRRPADEGDGDARAQNRQNAWCARVRVAQIFQFAMFTAARHGEIVKLKWSDIDWERGKVLIFQIKTGDYKEIPLIAPLAALLEERKPPKWRYVFTKGGNIYPKFYRILREACQALDIPYGRDLDDGLILHSARHTVTTRLIEAGLDLDTVGMITGHRAKELIAHYTHKHPGSVARAAEALEKINTRQGQS
jgi:integrase